MLFALAVWYTIDMFTPSKSAIDIMPQDSMPMGNMHAWAVLFVADISSLHA
jgi:hypothetical protein